MIREMSRFLRYGSIAVELNPVRQKAQLMRPPESGGRIATMSVPAGLQFRVQASRLACPQLGVDPSIVSRVIASSTSAVIDAILRLTGNM